MVAECELMENIPPKFLELSTNKRWKKCLMCGGHIRQIREAYFECCECKVSYIGDEEDMEEEIK